jgi:integrase
MAEPRTVPGVENRRRMHRDGTVYWTFRVRYTDHVGRRRGEEFDTQDEAVDFRAHLRLAQRSGRLPDLDRGRETMGEFVEEWWETWAAGNLERQTLTVYASVWNGHARDRIGHLQLRQVTPHVLARLRADLEQAGVGAPTITKLFTMLSSVLGRAAEWDRMEINPVRSVKKPKVRRGRAPVPLAPATVEALRDELHQARDRTLVSVLAYAGLRPEEALALQWRHIRKQTLLVEAKNVNGEIVVGQKTGRPPRTIDLFPSLRRDLAEYRLEQGADDQDLVFARTDGKPWRETDYRNWRARRYRPAAAAVGLAQPGRPYVLRHSFASLLIHEGRLSVAEIAEQMGHSIQMLLDNYTHVIAELRGEDKIPADTQIQRARAARRQEAM